MSLRTVRVTLAEEDLDFALDHILRHGDTDLFPMAVEFKAIQAEWPQWKKYFLEVDFSELSPARRPPVHGGSRSCLFPTHSGDSERVTQLDPLDSLVIVALVHRFGHLLERPDVRLPPSEVFSHRFEPDNKTALLFNPLCNHRSFVTACVAEAGRKTGEANVWTHVVSADICDLYARILPEHLVNALKGIEKWLQFGPNITPQQDLLEFRCFVRYLTEVLLVKWTSGKVRSGIPVACAATRLLAEIVLHQCDLKLTILLGNITTRWGLTQCSVLRFAEKYRIFCPSRRMAVLALQTLSEVLDRDRNLTLQGSATHLEQVEEYIERVTTTSTIGAMVLEALRMDGIDYHNIVDIPRLTVETLMALRDIPFREYLIKELDEKHTPLRNRDHALIEFALLWVAYLGEEAVQSVLSDVLAHLDELYPCVRGVAVFLKAAPKDQRSRIGETLKEALFLITGLSVPQRVYYLHVISSEPEAYGFNHQVLRDVYSTHSICSFTVAAVFLAVSHLSVDEWSEAVVFWLQNLIHSSYITGIGLTHTPGSEAPLWVIRAFYAAMYSGPLMDHLCLHFDSNRYQLDNLTTSVIAWAKAQYLLKVQAKE